MTEPGKSVVRASERIFQTARELFYREGTRAVGVDEIVAKACATKPTLYRAFGSKDRLIAAYLRERGEHFWTGFDAAVAAHPGDPRAQILAFLDATAEQALTAGWRGCGVTNAALEYPDPGHPARKVAVEHKAALRVRLREMTRAMEAR